MFRGASHKILKFPANVVCIHHQTYGYLLFDTGYSDLVYKNGWLSKLYNMANPTTFHKEDFIVHQLHRHRISIEDIHYIILSHAHPDHIGALSSFKNVSLIVSKQVKQALQASNLKALVFKNMIQDCSKKYIELKQQVQDTLLSKYFDKVYDIFQDQSIYAICLEGHAFGQIGIYIPEHKVLLAADSAWGEEYLHQSDKMKFIPRMIQADYASYVSTGIALQRFIKENSEIKVIFSHTMLTEETYA